jgi:hypothetical protein
MRTRILIQLFTLMWIRIQLTKKKCGSMRIRIRNPGGNSPVILITVLNNAFPQGYKEASYPLSYATPQLIYAKAQLAYDTDTPYLIETEMQI